MPNPSQHSQELNSKDIHTVVIILILGLLAVVSVIFWAAKTVSAQTTQTPGGATLPVAVIKDHPPKEYKLTEVQLLRLQVQQKDAMLLKAQMQEIQRQFGEKVGDLQRTAEKIKLENSWPPETRFDMDKLEFSAPVKEDKKP